MGDLSTGQSGKIAEYFLACALMSASGGRLSPFLPASDDHGVDLLVMERESVATLAIQVKSWRADKGAGRGTVQFDVRKATFVPSPRIALSALVLSPEDMALEVGWLIPMDRVPELAVEQAGKYALAPSRSPGSVDRYSPYRYADVSALTGAIADLLGVQV